MRKYDEYITTLNNINLPTKQYKTLGFNFYGLDKHLLMQL